MLSLDLNYLKCISFYDIHFLIKNSWSRDIVVAKDFPCLVYNFNLIFNYISIFDSETFLLDKIIFMVYLIFLLSHNQEYALR